jgi:hypothetical protein
MSVGVAFAASCRGAGPLAPSLLVKRLLDRYGAFSVDCRDVSPIGASA